MTPDEFDINIHLPKNPGTFAWEGGALLAQDSNFHNMVVTKLEYEEHGQDICRERFDI